MKRLVVGTAGHIDHGKTALVKALTGIDTDRLAEEKARGITIELGFAPMTLKGGQRLAFVDVPGHERFVRTMVAGAYGIDVVLLVVAADEGVMPQTREHGDILRLLGVRHGAVVLTKIDLVYDELLALAEADVEAFVEGTFLESAPVVACSAHTGQGLDRLLDVLEHFAGLVEERSSDGPFRMYVDRVFSLRGFGTVVTGTISSGHAAVGDTVEVLPAGFQARIRGLQVHGEEQKRAFAGQRSAVNLQGVDRSRLWRGCQLATPGTFVSSSLVDVSYEHLPGNSAPLAHRSRIRFLTGTAEIDGVAHLLGRQQIEPGARGFLQLRLDKPATPKAGDRYVLRLETPVVTLGGGRVIDPMPVKHRRKGRREAAGLLERLASVPGTEQASIWLELAGPGGVSLEDLARRSGWTVETLRQTFEASPAAVPLDPRHKAFVSKRWLDECKRATVAELEALHAKHPLKPGVARGELFGRIRFCGQSVFTRVMEALVAEGRVRQAGAMFALADFEPALDAAEADIAARLKAVLAKAGLAAPFSGELKEKVGGDPARIDDILDYLARQGDVTKIKEGYWVLARELEALRDRLEAHLEAEGELTPAAFKAMTGLTRKWAIPLLEYFDRVQLTLRVGDVRVRRTR